MSNPNLTPAQELAMLRAENEKLKQAAIANQPKLTLKVSAKGAVSIYGMGKFPVTLYPSQWVKVLDLGPKILEFMAQNKPALDAAKAAADAEKANPTPAPVKA